MLIQVRICVSTYEKRTSTFARRDALYYCVLILSFYITFVEKIFRCIYQLIGIRYFIATDAVKGDQSCTTGTTIQHFVQVTCVIHVQAGRIFDLMIYAISFVKILEERIIKVEVIIVIRIQLGKVTVNECCIFHSNCFLCIECVMM